MKDNWEILFNVYKYKVIESILKRKLYVVKKAIWYIKKKRLDIVKIKSEIYSKKRN